MLGKRHILDSIAKIARGLGRAPSLSEFTGLTEISKSRVFQLFANWNDAVRAAGLGPYRLYSRPGDSDLLEDWGELVRRKRAILSKLAYQLEGKHHVRTVERRFGSWDSVPGAFRNFAKDKPEWADVVELLAGPLPQWKGGRPRKSAGPVILANNGKGYGPKEESEEGTIYRAPTILQEKAQRAPFKDRATYGNPLDFRALRHEPVNEQGVVLLFGMLAKELGYVIEAVQTGFPDCEAKRQVGEDRWQRVQIEFEFESKNFHQHGHPSSGCDVIVCWRHNWDECPKHIEVVELASVIKSLTNLED